MCQGSNISRVVAVCKRAPSSPQFEIRCSELCESLTGWRSAEELKILSGLRLLNPKRIGARKRANGRT